LSSGVILECSLAMASLRIDDARKTWEIRPGGDALEVGFYTLDEALRMDLTTSVRGLLEKIMLNMIPLEKPIHHRTYRYID
jgi:hypothetical protein